jgi:hypothetical protein
LPLACETIFFHGQETASLDGSFMSPAPINASIDQVEQELEEAELPFERSRD